MRFRPIGNAVLGVAHIVHGLVLLVTLGALRTNFPHAAVLAMARAEMRFQFDAAMRESFDD